MLSSRRACCHISVFKHPQVARLVGRIGDAMALVPEFYPDAVRIPRGSAHLMARLRPMSRASVTGRSREKPAHPRTARNTCAPQNAKMFPPQTTKTQALRDQLIKVLKTR